MWTFKKIDIKKFKKLYHFDEIIIIIYKICCVEKIDDSSQVWANITHVNVYTS